MSVPYALYAENINMDSVINYLTNDSAFMDSVGAYSVGNESFIDNSNNFSQVDICKVNTFEKVIPISFSSSAVILDYDVNGNDIVVCGYIDTTSNWNSGYSAEDFFLAKIDTTGNVLWEITDRTSSVDVFHYIKGVDVVIDASGNIYVTGVNDAGYSANCGNTNCMGVAQFMVRKYNSNGVLLYEYLNNCNGPGNSEFVGISICSDSLGNAFAITTTYYNGVVSTRLVKINNSGALVWEKIFNEKYFNIHYDSNIIYLTTKSNNKNPFNNVGWGTTDDMLKLNASDGSTLATSYDNSSKNISFSNSSVLYSGFSTSFNGGQFQTNNSLGTPIFILNESATNPWVKVLLFPEQQNYNDEDFINIGNTQNEIMLNFYAQSPIEFILDNNLYSSEQSSVFVKFDHNGNTLDVDYLNADIDYGNFTPRMNINQEKLFFMFEAGSDGFYNKCQYYQGLNKYLLIEEL